MAADPTTLVADVERVKLEGLKAISVGIDSIFGIAAKEVAPVLGDVAAFVTNFIEAKLSGPAATYLTIILGLAGPAVAHAEADFTTAIGAELKALQAQVDTILASVK